MPSTKSVAGYLQPLLCPNPYPNPDPNPHQVLSAKSVTGYRGVTREGSRFIARQFVQVGMVHVLVHTCIHMDINMHAHTCDMDMDMHAHTCT